MIADKEYAYLGVKKYITNARITIKKASGTAFLNFE